MIGVIIVSHSEKLAEGLSDIAMEMNDGSVEIIAAGGADNGRIGTNSLKIKAAIEALVECDHILIFGDLGSSILSIEAAIDLVDDEIQSKIYSVDAPLVEGVIGGVIQATISNDVDLIIKTSKKAATLSKIS